MADAKLNFAIIGDDRASGAFLRVAAAARLTKGVFDDLGKSGVSIGKIALAPALIPTLGIAAGQAGALSSSLIATAGASAIFGAAVVGQVSAMKEQQEEIKKTRDKLKTLDRTSEDYTETAKRLAMQQKRFNEQFGPAAKGFTAMKSAWSEFLNSTKGVTVNVIGQTLQLVASVLPQLAPVAVAAGKAFGGLVGGLQTWVNSPAFDKVLNFFSTTGAQGITQWGQIVGNLFVGLGGILGNFAGPGERAAESLRKLTERFADWGTSKGASDSVDRFLRWMKENGPIVSNAFRAIADVAPKLVIALGNLGAINLVGITKFLELIGKLDQEQFNAVVLGMTGLWVASKGVALWGAGAALATGAWAGAIWLWNAAFAASGIGALVILVGLAALQLVRAWQTSETFRNVVKGSFRAVWGAAKAMAGGIVDAYRAIRDGAVRVGEGVRQKFVDLAAFCKSLPDRLVKAFSSLKTKMMQVGRDLISGMVSGVKSKAKELVSAVQGVVGGAVQAAKNLLGISSPSKVFEKIGQQVGEGYVKGLEAQRSKIKDKIKNLLDVRDQVASSFREAFGSSVFSQSFANEDGTSGASVEGILAYQREQAAKAEALRKSVKTLLSKGLSKDLIKQLLASGQSGVDQIGVLANGSKSDIRSLNLLNSQTNQALQAAGMATGNALYGDRIRDSRDDLRDLDPKGRGRGRRGGDTYQITVNGAIDPLATARRIQQVLLHLKRTNGGTSLGF